MTRSLWAVASASVLLIGAGGGTILAAGETGGLFHGGGPRGPIARAIRANVGRLITLREELNLTDEQKEAARKTLLAHKAEFLACVKDLHATRKKMGEMVRAEKTDEAAIHEEAGRLSKSVGDMAVLLAKARKEVLAILTPEQAKKVEGFRSEVERSIDQALEEAAKP